MKSVDSGSGDAVDDQSFLSRLAAAEASGELRVLRRLEPARYVPRIERPGLRLAICVDVESTGLDTEADEIIELSLVPISYTVDGDIVGTHPPFTALREPGRAIPPLVTRLTNIDADMVRGRTIDVAEVDAFIAPASILIAHNSSFDRKLLERLSPAFARKPFACTVEDADWPGEGLTSAKLDALATAFGFFQGVDRHRAEDDCLALIEILKREAPLTGGTVLGKVLASARRGRRRISVPGAPFALKDDLRRAGYRWNPGAPSRPKFWYKDVIDEFAAATERAFLASLKPACTGGEIHLTAFERFSVRG